MAGYGVEDADPTAGGHKGPFPTSAAAPAPTEGDMEGVEKDGDVPGPLTYAGETMEVGILRISDG